MPTDTKLTASTGEHYVCFALARRGWAASLTRDGLARSDILAVNTANRRMVEIQVKTVRDASSWPLGKRGIEPAATDHEWYVLVRLGDLAHQPDCFVVPRDHVAAATWIEHRAWLTDPDVPQGKRNAGIDRARVHIDAWEAYRDRWDELAEPSNKAKVRLPERMRAVLPRVGLPEGHPWRERPPRGWGSDAGRARRR